MRSGAGKDNEIIATLTIGNIVTLIEKSDNGWWLMDFEGISGYVSSSFLKKTHIAAGKRKITNRVTHLIVKILHHNMITI